MLMLTLDDAVKVCIGLLRETTYFDDMSEEEYESMPGYIRDMFEQKCWLPAETDKPAKVLNDLIFDINPAEICSQIESDNLKHWCQIIQVNMKMAMTQMKGWAAEE